MLAASTISPTAAGSPYGLCGHGDAAVARACGESRNGGAFKRQSRAATAAARPWHVRTHPKYQAGTAHNSKGPGACHSRACYVTLRANFRRYPRAVEWATDETP